MKQGRDLAGFWVPTHFKVQITLLDPTKGPFEVITLGYIIFPLHVANHQSTPDRLHVVWLMWQIGIAGTRLSAQDHLLNMLW